MAAIPCYTGQNPKGLWANKMIGHGKIAAHCSVWIWADGAKIRPVISAPAGWRHCQCPNLKKVFRHLWVFGRGRQLAHNKQNPCSRNVGGLLPPPFCSSFHHCIGLVYAKTQRSNAHLDPVLDFFFNFQRKNGLTNAHVCNCSVTFEFWLAKLIFLDAA